MRKIWLIRHSESRGNAGEVTEMPHSIALSELGHRQAVQLAQRFPCSPDLVVISGYQRTLETARPTIERFPESPVVQWPIHEFTFLAPNHYRGQTQEHRLIPVRAFWERGEPDYCDGEGAESFNDFMLRVRDCLARLRNASEQFIAVFTHGYMIKAILWESLYRGDRAPSEFMADFHAFHRAYPVLNGMIVPLLCDAEAGLFIGSPAVPLPG